MEPSPSVDVGLCGYLLHSSRQPMAYIPSLYELEKVACPFLKALTSICAQITITNIGFCDGRHVNGTLSSRTGRSQHSRTCRG